MINTRAQVHPVQDYLTLSALLPEILRQSNIPEECWTTVTGAFTQVITRLTRMMNTPGTAQAEINLAIQASRQEIGKAISPVALSRSSTNGGPFLAGPRKQRPRRRRA